MAIRVKAGIFTGIVAVAAIVGTACSGGSDRIDSSLPPPNVLNNLAGVYRKASISAEGKFVTCPNFSSGANLGSPKSDLTINGVVVDSCSTDDVLIIASSGTPGTGRYRIVSLAGVEDGNYKVNETQLVLTRDLINGVKLSPAPLQRIVMNATFNADGSLSLSAAPQPVGYTLKAGFSSGFNPDGSLNSAAVEPTVDSATRSTNVIVLSTINDVPQVNSDLSISVGPVANSLNIIDPIGYPRVRATVQNFEKKVFAPDETPPTPAPAPITEG